VVVVCISTKAEKTSYSFQAYDAPSRNASSQVYYTFNADNTQKAFVSNNSYITLQFSSDGSVAQKGFDLTYRAVGKMV